MRLKGSPNGKRNGRRLRQEMTRPEIALWMALRKNDASMRFRRQHAANDYVLDFYCAPAKLAIKVDGEAHNRGDRPEKDAAKDVWLAAQDILVLRFSAVDVLTNTDGVMRQIMQMALDRRERFAP